MLNLNKCLLPVYQYTSAAIFLREQKRYPNKKMTSLPVLSKEFSTSLYGQNNVFLHNCFIDTDELFAELLTLSLLHPSKKKVRLQEITRKGNSCLIS